MLLKENLSHFSVTESLRKFLIQDYKIPSNSIYVLRDCCNMMKLKTASAPFAGYNITELLSNSIVVVSSTSWTNDENFDILIDSLKKLKSSANGKRWVFIITGDGPNRTMYENQLKGLASEKLIIMTAWLSTTEYFGLLSTHTKS